MGDWIRAIPAALRRAGRAWGRQKRLTDYATCAG
jgi:hypothetical protein